MANSKGTDARRDQRRRQSTRRRPNSEAPPPDAMADEAGGSQTTDDYDDEPLSLAEEIADEVSRGVTDDTNDRYEKIKQGEIHIAELQKMSMATAHRRSPAGECDRRRRHEEAGPDLPHSQRTREDERADVRGRYVGNPAGRLRLSAQPGLPLSVVSGRYLRFAQPDSTFRFADRLDGLRPDSPTERKRTLLRVAAGRSHQLPGSKSDGRQGAI